MRFYIGIILFLNGALSYGQEMSMLRQLDSLYYSSKLDSLERLYGTNKEIPQEYRLAVLVSLSFYPELIQTPITFKYRNISTSMNSRPQLLSMMSLDPQKRKYVVRINKFHQNGFINLNKVPFNALVGLIGHELSHIVDYESKADIEIVLRALSYLNIRTKTIFEKSIDKKTIQHGLGWCLFDWATYVLNQSGASIDYKAFKKRVYLEPIEIQEKILYYFLTASNNLPQDHH